MNSIVIESKEDKDGDWIYSVSYKDEVVFTWNDCAHIDYPEDLTWDRLISEVFFQGVELGKKIGKESE